MKRSPLKRGNKPLRGQSALKRTRMSHKPKQGKRALVAEADAMIQQVSLTLSGGKCQFPGCSADAVDGHHMIHRRKRPTRWMPRNVPALCRLHHRWDDSAIFKQTLKRGLIRWLGGAHILDWLIFTGNTGMSPHPADALEDMQKVLDKQGGLGYTQGRVEY